MPPENTSSEDDAAAQQETHTTKRQARTTQIKLKAQGQQRTIIFPLRKVAGSEPRSFTQDACGQGLLQLPGSSLCDVNLNSPLMARALWPPTEETCAVLGA